MGKEVQDYLKWLGSTFFSIVSLSGGAPAVLQLLQSPLVISLDLFIYFSEK